METEEEAPEPVALDCPDCKGYGSYGEAGCCGYPLSSGECCGNAIEIQVQCKSCGGTGVIYSYEYFPKTLK